MLLNKVLPILLAVGIVGLGFGSYFVYKSYAESAPPAGAILVPSDLLKDFDPALKEAKEASEIIKTQQARIEKVQPLIEQTLRVTLDRAGIKPEDWGKYEFDQDLKGFKLRKSPGTPGIK